MTTEGAGPALGLLLPTREMVVVEREDPEALLGIAERAEAAGLDSLWVGDSLLARPRFEPLGTLCAVAARTRRVTLGTAVLLPALRQPLLLAHAVATLDRIARGRLVLGVGAGFDYEPTRSEFEAVGLPFEGRWRRLIETLGSCREAWSGGALRPRPHRSGGPPVWLGTGGPAGLRRAARVFDGWIPTSPTPEAYAEGLRRIEELRTGAGRADAEFTAAAYLTVTIASEPGAAEKELDDYLGAYYGAPPDQVKAIQGCFGGSARECVEWVGRFADAGARHIVLRLGSFDFERQLELLCDELLPELRSVGATARTGAPS